MRQLAGMTEVQRIERREERIKEQEQEMLAAKRGGYAAKSAAEFFGGMFAVLVPCIIAVIAAGLLRTFVMVNVTVPSGSMERTIHTGDMLIASRVSYVFNEPERGDIIVFYFPDDESQLFIKRIIGLPGETVRIEGNEIYINNADEPLTENYLPEDWTGEETYVFEVPEDSYFVMGDNRNSSYDARYWENTYVTFDKIVAKALFAYSPTFRWLEHGDSIYS